MRAGFNHAPLPSLSHSESSPLDSKNEAVIKRCDEKEMRVARLKRDIETLQSTPVRRLSQLHLPVFLSDAFGIPSQGELVELDKDYVNLQKQLTSFKAYIAEKDAKITEYQQVGSHIKGHIATAGKSTACTQNDLI